MKLIKTMKLIFGRRRMSKEQKLAALEERFTYIKTVLVPKIPPSERPAALLKIQQKYDKLVKKVQKGK